MHLSPHSLQQIDDAYIESLDPEALRGLSLRLLADLKEAWDRLNQGPDNSSRPSSSRAPWNRKHGGPDAEAEALAADGAGEAKPDEAKPMEGKPARRGRVGPRCFMPMRSRPIIRGRVGGVDTPWPVPVLSPIPAFNRWICTGAIRRHRD